MNRLQVFILNLERLVNEKVWKLYNQQNKISSSSISENTFSLSIIVIEKKKPVNGSVEQRYTAFVVGKKTGAAKLAGAIHENLKKIICQLFY